MSKLYLPKIGRGTRAMSTPTTTVWELEPHTEAKHVILRNYLKAWFSIMGLYNDRLLFIDGYAGPGLYSEGQDGSPIIVLKEAMNFLDYCRKHGRSQPAIILMFIEEDSMRVENLNKILHTMKIPRKIHVEVHNSSFENATEEVLNGIDVSKETLIPAFVFIDPFGYDLRFDLIKRLMSNEKCEVFINFMYEFINRFITRSGQEAVMTRLFGSEEWSKLEVRSKTPNERKKLINDLYQKQLLTGAAKYVRSFEMVGSRNATKYYLYYGTKHRLGLEKMKEAMWKVDSGGNFSFSDATNPNQAVLFGNEPDFDYLSRLLVQQFSGSTVSIEGIEEFVICDTPFLKTHIKRGVLAPLEKKGHIDVITSSRKKSFTYPAKTVIRFNI